MLPSQHGLLASDNLQLWNWAQNWWPCFSQRVFLHNVPICTRNLCYPYQNDLHSLLWKLCFCSNTFDQFHEFGGGCLFVWLVGLFCCSPVRVEIFPVVLLSFLKNCQCLKMARWKPSECYWGALCLVQEFVFEAGIPSKSPRWLFLDAPKLSMCLTFFSLL